MLEAYKQNIITFLKISGRCYSPRVWKQYNSESLGFEDFWGGICDPATCFIGLDGIVVLRANLRVIACADCVEEVLELCLIHVILQIQVSLQHNWHYYSLNLCSGQQYRVSLLIAHITVQPPQKSTDACLYHLTRTILGAAYLPDLWFGQISVTDKQDAWTLWGGHLTFLWAIGWHTAILEQSPQENVNAADGYLLIFVAMWQSVLDTNAVPIWILNNHMQPITYNLQYGVEHLQVSTCLAMLRINLNAYQKGCRRRAEGSIWIGLTLNRALHRSVTLSDNED